MKEKIVKSTLFVAAAVISAIGIWKTHEYYGNVTNTLLAENVEALSQKEDETWLDKLLDDCYDSFATMKSIPCKTSETNASSNTSVGANVSGTVDGVTIGVGGSFDSSSSYNHTEYSGKSQFECKGGFTTSHCDRREQTDCDGKKFGSAGC